MEARNVLRSAVAPTVDLIWLQKGQQNTQLVPTAARGEILYEKIQELSPKNDTQHALRAQASSVAIDIAKIRWLMLEA